MSETDVRRSQQRIVQRTAVAAAALVSAAVFLVVVIASVTEFRSPTVVVSDVGIIVSSGATTVSLPHELIVSASLEEALPPVTKRFGWGSAATLRGQYRLGESLGYVDVTRRRGPFVMLRTRSEFVLLNLAEPSATRALFDDIVRRWPAIRADRPRPRPPFTSVRPSWVAESPLRT